MRGLKGKVAIVSGGSSGIGKAICKAYVSEGAYVVIADIDEDKAKAVLEDLNRNRKNSHFVKTDISNEKDIVNLIHEAINEFGKIDILVNCAAAFIMRGIEATMDEWQKIMSVNIMGYALCAKHAAPEIVKSGGGAIVNICSISGFIAQPKFVTYNATKGAVANMTRCMALDLAQNNIRVNAVCPGTVWTKSNEDFIGREYGLDRKGADAHPDIGGAHMIKRCADPEEIADAVLFLSADNSSFITGENLMVDGGYTAK